MSQLALFGDVPVVEPTPAVVEKPPPATIDDDREFPKPWLCDRCGESNASWATDCRRCDANQATRENQLRFDGIEAPWMEHWQSMPEFCQHDLQACKWVIVRFKTMSDFFEFAERIEKKVTVKTKSLWYPEIESRSYVNKRYRCVE
jgi:ribosomal protein L40E